MNGRVKVALIFNVICRIAQKKMNLLGFKSDHMWQYKFYIYIRFLHALVHNLKLVSSYITKKNLPALLNIQPYSLLFMAY